MLLINKAILIVILSVLLYAIIAIFSDLRHFIEDFQTINLIFIPFILVLITCSILIKAIRQRMILNGIGIQISLLENVKLYITGLSMLVTPGSGGEVIKAHFLKKNYEHTMSKTIPCVFVERYHDFLAVVILLLITLIIFNPLESRIIVFFSLILIFIVIIFIVKKNWLILLETKIEKIKLFKNFFVNKEEFNNSLFVVFKPKLMSKLLALSMISIGFECMGVYFGFISIIPNANFINSIQMFYTTILAGLFSFLPGGVGVTEGSLIGLLLKSGIKISQASFVTLFIRLTTLWFATILGFSFLRYMKKRDQKYFS